MAARCASISASSARPARSVRIARAGWSPPPAGRRPSRRPGKSPPRRHPPSRPRAMPSAVPGCSAGRRRGASAAPGPRRAAGWPAAAPGRCRPDMPVAAERYRRPRPAASRSAAVPQCRRHRGQRPCPVGYMDQHEPGMHQIERPRLRGRISGDVVPAHLVPVACLHPRRADVRGQHVPGRADGRGERLRMLVPPAPTSQQREPALTPSRSKCPRVIPSNSSASQTNRSPASAHALSSR